jgi:hypothetical protein
MWVLTGPGSRDTTQDRAFGFFKVIAEKEYVQAP